MQNLNESLQAKYPHLELAILPLSQVKKVMKLLGLIVSHLKNQIYHSTAILNI